MAFQRDAKVLLSHLFRYFLQLSEDQYAIIDERLGEHRLAVVFEFLCEVRIQDRIEGSDDLVFLPGPGLIHRACLFTLILARSGAF